MVKQPDMFETEEKTLVKELRDKKEALENEIIAINESIFKLTHVKNKLYDLGESASLVVTDSVCWIEKKPDLWGEGGELVAISLDLLIKAVHEVTKETHDATIRCCRS